MLAVTMALSFTGCGSSTTKTKPAEQAKAEKIVYTCTMHPEIIRDKPGDCPICGMTLVEKKVMATDSTYHMSGDSTNEMMK